MDENIDSPMFCKVAIRFVEGKPDSPKHYKAISGTEKDSTTMLHILGIYKPKSPMFYKTATRFADVKTDPTNLYQVATRFAEVKTDFPKHKAATRFPM